jgi:hypothetical protein
VAIERSTANEIQAQVEAQYADRLATAGPLRRLWLRICIRITVCRRISAEMERISAEIERQAPRDALYAAVGNVSRVSESRL